MARFRIGCHTLTWGNYSKVRDFTELGKGVLRGKIKNILETLEKINYTNWIIVELDRTFRTPSNSAEFESARISRDFLKEAGY